MDNHNVHAEAGPSRAWSNPDGDDYEDTGKYFMYKGFLRKARVLDVSEEAKLHVITLLKEELIPFWHRSTELYDRESEELMAVFLKYNGPKSIRMRQKQEHDEIKAKIAGSKYAAIFQAILPLGSIPSGPKGTQSFSYGNGGEISYHKMLAVEMEAGSEKGSEENASRGEHPIINLVPLGAGDSIPHHNMNPDDDLSLNPILLKLLHRIMEQNIATPFTNFDLERRDPSYYQSVTKPRWFKFIEQGLKSDSSLGYGATAFFNDMLLLFRNAAFNDGDILDVEHSTKFTSEILEMHMEKLLKDMGSVGEQLLALYQAIKEQGVEDWPDPEIVYFQHPYHPRSPDYNGTKPDENAIRALAWEQLKNGQRRVRQLRGRLASTASNTAQSDRDPAHDGAAQLDSQPRKRLHEEGTEPNDEALDHRSKRRRSDHSASPGPSDPGTDALGRATSKRPRGSADNDGDESGQETEQGEVPETRAAKRQRMTKAVAPSHTPTTSSGASDSGSHAAVPPRPSTKRARTPSDIDDDGDEQGDGDSHETSGSKRRRLTKRTSAVGPPVASPEAEPSSAGEATQKPAAQISDSVQPNASSAAGQSAPEQQQHADVITAPSSQPLNFSTNTVTMGKLAKMGKTRPWVFGYSTDEGDGIYAFTKCPGQNCKYHFSSHPLRDGRARDHLLGCGQPILDEQDMVRQYASQVVKDTGRKSGLTIEWARKSNMILLPSGQKDNHPDNFPLPPAGK